MKLTSGKGAQVASCRFQWTVPVTTPPTVVVVVATVVLVVGVGVEVVVEVTVGAEYPRKLVQKSDPSAASALTSDGQAGCRSARL